MSTVDQDVIDEGVVCTCWPTRRRDQQPKKQSRGMPEPAKTSSPKQQQQQQQQHSHSSPKRRHTMTRQRSLYHEALNGVSREIPNWVNGSDGDDDFQDCRGSFMMQSTGDNDTAFFDTAQSEEDFPVNGDNTEYDDPYPIITTMSIKPKPRVSILQPHTMLLQTDSVQTSLLEDSFGEFDGTDDLPMSNQQPQPQQPKQVRRRLSRSLSKMFQRSKSIKSSRKLERTTTQALREPLTAVSEKGFPGQLTKEELEQALKLARELKKPHNQVLADMVYLLRDIEDEPFALCRFLRSTKFNADETLQRLKKSSDAWQKANKHNFYPRLPDALGCPGSLFLTQYPITSLGYAKNGCPVTYLQAGKIRPEGLLSLVTLENAKNFFWHQSTHAFRKAIKASKEVNPDLYRMESIVVIDLKGVTASDLSSPALTDCVKLSTSVADCFPETLHCMVVVNAPSIFSLTWSVMRRLIDPRTAQRIQVFSSSTKAFQRLHELIDLEQLPTDFAGTNMSLDDKFASIDDNDDNSDTNGEVVNSASALRKKDDDNNSTQLKSKQQSPIRREVNLLYLKRRGTAKHTIKWNSSKSKLKSIRIHTRSTSSAKFRIETANGKNVICEDVVVRGKEEGGTVICNGGTELPLRDNDASTELVVIGTDQNDATNTNKDTTKGYFLVEVQFENREK
eukprot:CAMPEP_0119570826 /NCGR_PEP_ID=MMETSP1352-20130426/43813_1 /TAXON_ID=265584 /ORGANISM="Stauroneis constricta, Strain CCMP1120" /LENGTH=675 /DNA_ID=CAMNT_0007620503 /DNA_START=586 /DNA_END=2613 /DNA_ORIENTATION=-